jgi:hypothetical protein
MHALAGWFLIYLAISGAVGFAFWQPLTNEPSCLPRIDVFGLLATTCTIPIVDTFWYFAVEVPRFAIVLLGLPLGFVLIGLKGIVFAPGSNATAYSSLWNAAPFLRATGPLLLLILAGTTYWWARLRVIAFAAPAAFVSAAVYIATRM